MSEKIVQLNEDVIKGQLKELVRGSVEETLNELLEAEAEKLTQAARYERNEQRQGYRSGHYNRNLTTCLLYTSTVLENIRYGNLDAIDEECKTAAKLANADGFIRRLPDGYDTMLTGDGANLSQGQRQLIAIARAAVADPPEMCIRDRFSPPRMEISGQQAWRYP